MQGTQNLYFDWDLKLPALSSLHYPSLSSSHDDEQLGVVDQLRKLALQTPLAICEILANQLKCIPEHVQQIHVLVKEGTRPSRIELTKRDLGDVMGRTGGVQLKDQQEWKISFHFIFQIVTTPAQFRRVYQAVQQAVFTRHRTLVDLLDKMTTAQSEHKEATTTGSHGAVFLKAVLQQQQQQQQHKDDEATISSDNVSKALIGVDLHPLTNKVQGLACLGSRKLDAVMGNRLLGIVRVPLIRRRQEQKFNSSSTSTVIIKDMEWLPDYGAKEHPLLILTEALILIPGPRCVGLLNMKEWTGHDNMDNVHASSLSSPSSSLSSSSCTCLSSAKRKHENNNMCAEKEDECLQDV